MPPHISIPLNLISAKDLQAFKKQQPSAARKWLAGTGFSAKAGEVALVPDAQGNIQHAVGGLGDHITPWNLAQIAEKLPTGYYRIESKAPVKQMEAWYLGWLLGSYHYTRYKRPAKTDSVTIMPPKSVDASLMEQIASSITFARDLINTPANDLGPEELAEAVQKTAQRYKAKYKVTVGEQLLKANYPAIHTVGKASSRAPRLCDFTWGNPKHPKVTLVGKGVCFDSGGLDIKPSSGMKLMKKDMGGAACVLALAQLIMHEELSVRLRVLIPAVENSISGDAYRPSDVIATRKGISVEVGNTDAEGRLILCDALYEADQERPDLLIDCATLTGAARTALGTDIPALFSPSDKLANALQKHAEQQHDPLWRLPLWPAYRDMLNSPIADINSAPDGPYAGAITAALYLKEFVTHTKEWAHIDMMAWNLHKRPGRPAGGEAMAVRALFAYLRERFI